MREGFNLKYSHELSDIFDLVEHEKSISHVSKLSIEKIFNDVSMHRWKKFRRDGEIGFDVEWMEYPPYFDKPRWVYAPLANPKQTFVKIFLKFGSQCFLCKKIHRNRSGYFGESIFNEIYGRSKYDLIYPDPFCSYCTLLFSRLEIRINRSFPTFEDDSYYKRSQLDVLATLLSEKIVNNTKKTFKKYVPKRVDYHFFKYIKQVSKEKWAYAY